MKVRNPFAFLAAICLVASSFALWRGLLSFRHTGVFDSLNLDYFAGALRLLKPQGWSEAQHVAGPWIPITEESIMLVLLAQAFALGLMGLLCGVLAKRAREPSQLYALPAVLGMFIAAHAGYLLWVLRGPGGV